MMLAQVQPRTLDTGVFVGNTHIKLGNVSSQIHSLSQAQKKKKVKDKKTIMLGVEFCKSLQWQNWEPGKEFIRTLTLKNVRLKTQKIRFSTPSSNYFTTLYPQTVTLNAGTSFSLPVTFRPVEKRDYEDSIAFDVEDGTFSVPLRAILPRHHLHFQEILQLPNCAVCGTSEGSFILQNTTNLQTVFRWEVPQPFVLLPASGVLEPKCEIQMKVLFQPQAALVYDGIATCWFGVNEQLERSIRLLSIAKYPHLIVSIPGNTTESDGGPGPTLHFGHVGVGTMLEKHIEIHNLTMVDSPFRIEHAKQPSHLDSNFHCEVVHALAPAQGKLKIPVQFCPRAVGVESVDYFHLIPAGNFTKTVVKVSGTCQGPQLSLSKPMLNFDLVNIGNKVLRTLEITNSSIVSAHYQFDIDSSESVFSFDRSCGTLGPGDTHSLHVTFSPNHTIPYYRRVACLIHHQEPLFLDLIGTCHSDLDTPAVLLPKHVSLYKTNRARGFTGYPPDILSAMLQEGKLSIDAEGALVPLTQDEDEKLVEGPVDIDPVSEIYDDGISTFPFHVTASTREFEFGCFSIHSLGEKLPLSLTNHTKGKLIVIWTSKQHSPFRVSPEYTEIPPLKSTSFRVVFHPSQPNTLYGGELEGFMFYKVLRDYRNVEDATICPPWCITLRARGHTFELGHEHFVATCVLDSPKMVFPPVNQNGQALRTLLLQNTGTSALTYLIDNENSPSVQVKPTSALVAPGYHQVILLRTEPNDRILTKHCLSVQFNYSNNYIQNIVLFSRAETPQLLLEQEGRLYFKPTCVGCESQHLYTLKNCSRVPLNFRWNIQHEDTPFFSVNPASGIIKPNETMAQIWTFVPQDEKKYTAKATVIAWVAKDGWEPIKKCRYVLRITGDGCVGSIFTQEEQVDLGNILVGSFQSCDLMLLNKGDCTLIYSLSAKQEITGPCDLDEVINDPVALEFEHKEGQLPARAKLSFTVTARPARRLQYQWTISYRILTPKAQDPENAVGKEQFLCCVTAQGVYPSLTIVDACPAGSASSLSKFQLWRFFSLERMNTYLQSDPTPEELIYRVPTRHSTSRRPHINTPVLLDFNFGAAPVGTEPFVALLLLENKGIVSVTWDFLFPADQQIELEYWAETWEFNPSEIHQMRIQDNKLFSVSPRSGVLSPGQQQRVQLMYRHDFVGTDRLPVLLKLSHGREILLNFIGVTVESGQRYVHFTGTKHTFTPMAIGSSNPSKQIYELFNGGSVAVIYEIDLEPLRKIQEQNYHHPIFQCLNPRGEILPGSTACVEWIFSPLEAKTYSVNVPIHILGGDSALITFEGIGYDRNVLGESAVFEVSSPIVTTPRLKVPGQVVYITQQKVTFGDMPVFCKSSRLLFLNNPSQSEAAFFTWYAGSANASQTLQVSPLSGVARPGESTNITVTIQTGEQAAFYILDLVCEIYMEKALAMYEEELVRWEEEEERQSVEFTVSDTKMQPSGTSKNILPSSGFVEVKANQRLTEIQRYKTLPPIKNAEAIPPPASRDRKSRRAEKEAQRVWSRPEPPAPLQLHLLVTGRSYYIPDFLSQFQNDFQRHFQNQLPTKQAERPAYMNLQPETGESEVNPKKLSPETQEMATDIMASIIRNLLDDTHFHEELAQTQNDPLPYFSQLGSQGNLPAMETITGNVELIPSERKARTPPASQEEQEMEGITTNSHKAPKEESHVESQMNQHPLQDEELKENAKRTPAFSQMIESVLENTLLNILVEANRGEVVLTTRPRVIALPPVTPRGFSPTSTARSISLGQNMAGTPTTKQQTVADSPRPFPSAEGQ
ncbi:cilia- and flagella-associated protein 65 isoform X2 [Xenopus laevis]|uniref:Cilia- and flagella-associated protein 65 isoform X2 n=1 Tax=Xenopus laevis TaxID=8355 RepID=A0A8J0TU86_XENLA|nr:cilia- and flagella-associated protein 65 isoform X2 [Xenopus laevis]